MPALPAVPKCVRLDIKGNGGVVNSYQDRLFFEYSGALSTADATTWLGNISTALGTFYTAQINSDWTVTTLVLTDLTSASSAQVVLSTSHAGGVGTTPLSAAVALVLKKNIARRYRGGHPRFYQPGLSVANRATIKSWDPTFLASILSSFNTFIAACVANTNPVAIGTITHVSISYFHLFTNVTNPITGRARAVPTPRATPLIDPVISITTNPVIASQRRRNEQP